MKNMILLVALAFASVQAFAVSHATLRKEAAKYVIATSGGHFDRTFTKDFTEVAYVMTKAQIATYPELKDVPKDLVLVNIEVGDCVVDEVVVFFRKNSAKPKELWTIDFSERESQNEEN